MHFHFTVVYCCVNQLLFCVSCGHVIMNPQVDWQPVPPQVERYRAVGSMKPPSSLQALNNRSLWWIHCMSGCGEALALAEEDLTKHYTKLRSAFALGVLSCGCTPVASQQLPRSRVFHHHHCDSQHPLPRL